MNILIVGLGSIGRKHLNALRQLGNRWNIYALRSGCGSSTPQGVRNIYSLDELKDIPLDFAVISNPTAAHKQALSELTSLNCPLFVEKPIYHRLDILEEVVRIRSKRLLTYVACNLRFLECLEFVKEQVGLRAKRINEVNVYCGSYLPDWRPGVDFRQVYSALPELGGGVHIDLIHELDYICWLFGLPAKSRAVFRNRSSLGIEACDYANYCLVYDSFCANVVLNYYRRDSKRTLELVFDDEVWLVDLLNNTVRCDGEILFASDRRIQDTYVRQLDYFIRLVREHAGKSFNTLEDAYNILKICLGEYDTER